MNDMGMTHESSRTGEQHQGHSLMASDRRDMVVKGVTEVISFDETLVRLVTVCGVLNLEGEGLRVHVLNLKDGVVAVTGQLNGVLYEDVKSPADDVATHKKARSRRLFG